MSTESVLDNPPSTVDEDEPLRAMPVTPPSRRSTQVTRALLVLLVLGVGVVTGLLLAGQSSAASPAGAVAGVGSGQLPSGFPEGIAGRGGAGLPGGAAGGRGDASDASSLAVVGTVTRVDGDTLVVEDLGGTEQEVRISDGTTITESRTLSPDELEAGRTVSVSGTTADDGSVDADAITAR